MFSEMVALAAVLLSQTVCGRELSMTGVGGEGRRETGAAVLWKVTVVNMYTPVAITMM